MTIPYRKKLIEVSLPLAAINAESAREKSIRHGHPSTLHLWWARRPLAACRAVLFSSLVDDPDSDPQYLKPDGTVDEEAAGFKRADLFNLIEELVMWENSNNPDVIRSARAEIARCVASRLIETGKLKKDSVVGPSVKAHDLVKRGHCKPQSLGLDKKVGRVRFSFDVARLPPGEVVNAFLAEHAPPVVDPFAGGGSIPIEAQRLGLRVYASDLNPVAVLINKALIELPQMFAGFPPVHPQSHGKRSTKGKKQQELVGQAWHGANGLAEDFHFYGQWMRDQAQERIGHFFPSVEVTETMAEGRPDLGAYVGRKLTVIAWIWARTVASPNPATRGAHVPLVRSFWLSTKKDGKAWVHPVVDPESMTFEFIVKRTGNDVQKGTVDRTGVTCLLTGTPFPLDHVRQEGKARRLGQRLMAVVAEGTNERVFLPATADHEELAKSASPNSPPETELPEEALGFRVQNYGMIRHADLFTNRQLVALETFAQLVEEARQRLVGEGRHGQSYADAIATFLGLLVSKAADYWSSLCTWRSDPKNLGVGHVFSRQAVSMIWDFAECNPFSASSGSWDSSQRWTELVLKNTNASGEGTASQASASSLNCPQPALISTDPPYYDNVPYADLSDFFYIWLRRCLQPVHSALLGTVLVPKVGELVADPFRHGGKESAREFFERGMAKVFEQMRLQSHADFPTTIYYAFKQSEGEDETDDENESENTRASTGWETFLQGLADTGWQIDGTWPIRTEMGNRTRSMASNALASSIVLVCRRRPDNASLATRKEFITTLRRELPDALRNLQRGNIAPVDLAQAAIGPGMAVFTRYTKVLESDGSPMSVRTALGLINQSLDEVLAEQEGEFDSDTRWTLAWFEQFGMDEGPYGDAETLSKAKNTAINGLVDAGVIVAKAGKVRLLRRDELPHDWNPTTDKRLPFWEVTQHLIHRLDKQGETGAAELVKHLGGMAEVARDLAYRLYATCERKKWAQEALAYNSLVVAWPELNKLALAQRNQRSEIQQDLF